jgi:hypothetical protein
MAGRLATASEVAGGHTIHTILKRACSADLKMVRYVLRRKEIVSTNYGHILHSLTVFRYAMIKIHIGEFDQLDPYVARSQEDIPYHFRIGRPCPFLNGEVCPPATSKAGAKPARAMYGSARSQNL